MMSATITTPAKINLGLEILGKRDDGYHEIRTVLCMLEISDVMTVAIDPQGSGTELEGIPVAQNLIARVLKAFQHEASGSPAFSWTLDKRIPIAAGLGGASSNAAGALLAANSLVTQPLPGRDLTAIADAHGSDISFFLGQSCALATGRGIHLERLPSITGDVLLVIPSETLGNKTTTMYRNLCASDFSDGSSVTSIVEQIRSNSDFPPGMIRNAFQRPLAGLAPIGATVMQTLDQMPCLPWGLSGAGPAHFVLAPQTRHRELADAIRTTCGQSVTCLSTSFRDTGLELEMPTATDLE